MQKKLIYALISILLFSVLGSITTQAQDNKKIYIREEAGQLVYEGNTALLENQFLVNKEMLHGEVYMDSIEITNETDTAYEFFFNISPKVGSDEGQLVLLESIHTKVSYDGKVIYEGSAKGFTSKNGTTSSTISLGKLEANKTSIMEVEYGIQEIDIEHSLGYYVQKEYEEWIAKGSLPSEIPTSYKTQQEAAAKAKEVGAKGIVYDAEAVYKSADLQHVLSETTWSFSTQKEAVKEEEDPKPSPNPKPEVEEGKEEEAEKEDDNKVIMKPGTGDNNNQIQLIALVIISALVVGGMYRKMSKKTK